MTTTELTGLVVKTQSGFYTVKPDQPDYPFVTCRLRGALKQLVKKTELCVIGDHVSFELLEDGSGAISGIAPRGIILSRTDPSSSPGTSAEHEQVLIANLDQAVFVFSAANPAPHPRMLDRFLVVAEKAHIPSIVIVANKIDLAEADARATFAVYEHIGYRVLYVSARGNLGIDELRAVLAGKISIFTGPSGVGKSSLLNTMQPGLGRIVNEVSAKLTKGRHTTVNAELIPLESGGYVADTPGIRAVAPWDVEPDELDAYFREIHPHVSECRFSDCSHVDDPGCGVRAAVAAGKISQARYDSYLKLRDELDAQYIY